jgi:hypothetical protein
VVEPRGLVDMTAYGTTLRDALRILSAGNAMYCPFRVCTEVGNLRACFIY